MVGFVTPSQTRVDAFRAEAAALTAVTAGLTDADLRRPSPCPPWTIAGLLGHLVVAAGRIEQAIAAGRDPGAAHDPAHAQRPLVTAAGYYRPDHRFSPAVNADRIDVAAALARTLGTATAISAALASACERTLALLTAAPPGLEVRTRHGDRMLLTEFALTRVVELGVHGLDLAIGLNREPWLTGQAATVLEELLLPDGSQSGAVRARLGYDRTGLIARLTGRAAMSPAEQAVLAEGGLTSLALG